MAAHAIESSTASNSSSSDMQFYSRQYYVYGAGAMEKLRSSRVLLIGVGKLGAEIAKNLVLSGVSSLLLFDPAPVTADDLQGHLWISPDELSLPSSSIDESPTARSRAAASLAALQELNPRCSVEIFNARPSPPSTCSSTTEPATQQSSRLRIGTSADPLDNNSIYHIELEQLADVRPNCVVCSVPNLGRNKLFEIACFCRVLEISFVHVDVVGLAGRLFCDFGEVFQSLDPLGEHREDVLFSGLEVSGIDRHELLVTIVGAGARPGAIAEGDLIKFGDIPPASQGTPLRGSGHLDRCEDWTFLNSATATVLAVRKDASVSPPALIVRVRLLASSPSSSSLSVPSLPQSVSRYFGSGALRFLPKPAEFHHQCLTDLLDNPSATNLPIVQSELTDDNRARQLHVLFCSRDLAIDDRCTASLVAALPANHRAVGSYLQHRAQPQLLAGIDPLLFQSFYATSNADLPPLHAFFGGFAAQEVIKAVTHRYSPLSQLFYLDLLDLVEPLLLREADGHLARLAEKSRLWYLGEAGVARLQQSRVFLVGAGAIGCELLKNLGALGVGEVTVTDDDAIEQSNLNRQFLFRDSDIGKLKSEVACSRVSRTLRSTTRGQEKSTKFTALRYRVQQSTEHVFTDDFYRSQSLVLNALDNVPARLYVDSRCVATRVPMIDSGTLGTQGHVQVVVPALTESYASQADPDAAQQQIPLCTLKSFPHNITHCIEWARDLCFEKQLLIKPTVWNRVFFSSVSSADGQVVVAPLRPPAWSQIDATTLSILSKLASAEHERLPDFAACVRLARAKFDKYFDHDPRKLLELFPVDHVTAEGEVFWAPPRRLPSPLTYQPVEPMHAAFVFNFSKLLAAVWRIVVPVELDSIDTIAHLAANAVVPRFSRRHQLMSSTPSVVDVLSSKRNAALRSSTSLLSSHDEALLSPSSSSSSLSTPKRSEEAIAQELQKLKDYWQAETQLPHLNGIEFDKDDPSGTHVGLVAAAANLRATVYGIEPQDVLSVKRIAGRILPAIAATTSCVSGIVCFELLKYCKHAGQTPRLESFRNAWLNLAVPALMLSEPAAPASHSLGPDVSFTLWDTWEVHGKDLTVAEFVDELTALSGGLSVSGIFQGSRIVYFDCMHDSRLPSLVTSFLDLEATTQAYVMLAVTFLPANESDEDLIGPAIRFHWN